MEEKLDLVEETTETAVAENSNDMDTTTDIVIEPTSVEFVTEPKHKPSVGGVIVGTAIIGGIGYVIYKYGKKATSWIISKAKKNKKAKVVDVEATEEVK